jgi:hypothetical protein
VLAAAVVDARGRLFVQVLQRGEATGQPLVVKLEAAQKCEVKRQPGRWEDVRTNAALDPQSQQLFAYLEKHGLAFEVRSAFIEVVAADCAGLEPKSWVGAQASLKQGDPRYSQVLVARSALKLELLTDGPGAAPVVTARPSTPEYKPQATSGTEQEWRERFREARRRIDRVEEELREKKRFVQMMDGRAAARLAHQRQVTWDPEEMEKYERYKRDLAQAETVRADARRALEDVERAAANAAVPFEWRK